MRLLLACFVCFYTLGMLCSCGKGYGFYGEEPIELSEDYTVELSQNDTLVVVPYVIEDCQFDSVEYYWDSNHLVTLYKMPFVLRKSLENEEKGKHYCFYYIYSTYYYDKRVKRFECVNIK